MILITIFAIGAICVAWFAVLTPSYYYTQSGGSPTLYCLQHATPPPGAIDEVIEQAEFTNLATSAECGWTVQGELETVSVKAVNTTLVTFWAVITVVSASLLAIQTAKARSARH